MKHHVLAFCMILVFAVCALAQESAPASQAPAGNQAKNQPTNNASINATLNAYVNAYGKRSIDDLVAVWPDLANQKKEYKRVKEHFSDQRVSNEKLSLDSCEAQAVKDQAMATCQQTEEFVRTDTETTYGGDAMMASPAQRPPPVTQNLKHNEKRTKTVWIKLNKDGGAWKIVSVSDKKQSL
jgi:hypothetical protein